MRMSGVVATACSGMCPREGFHFRRASRRLVASPRH